MPNSCAIAFAVKTWSPVIITALIPAFLHTATACFTSGLGGSIIPIIPANVNSFSNIFCSIAFGFLSHFLKATAITRSACSASSPFIFFACPFFASENITV